MANLNVRALDPADTPARLIRDHGWAPAAIGASLTLDAGITVGYDGDVVFVDVTAAVTQSAVERLNALLRGLRGPRLNSYWRAAHEPAYADRIRPNVDGAWMAATRVPLTFTGRRNPDGTTFAWTVNGTIAVLNPPARRVPGSVPMTPSTFVPVEPDPIQDQVELPVVVAEPVVAAPVVASPATPAGSLFESPAQTLKPFKVYHDPKVHEVLQTALREHKTGVPVVVALLGPTGVGKSLTASQLAAEAGYPFMKVDAMGLNTFADWMGARDLVETPSGAVISTFVPSAFTQAIDAHGEWAGIKRMVLVDEANRGSHTASMNVFLPLTDGTGTIYVPDAGKPIRVDPAVLFVLTANVGANYGGTQELDAAVLNRIDFTEVVPYPSAAHEAAIIVEQGGCTLEQAQLLVRVAAQVRGMVGVSIRQPGVATRQLVKAGRHVKHGLSLIRAAEAAFVNTYDEGDARKAVLDAANGILQPAR